MAASIASGGRAQRGVANSAEYIDNLVSTTKIDVAAIYSRAGDSVWAQSPSFNVSAPEIAEVAKGFDNPGGLQASGLHIQGVKYFLLKADDRSVYGKKDDTGIIAVRTNQAIILAHYKAPTQPGEATQIVEKLGDYLITVGY